MKQEQLFLLTAHKQARILPIDVQELDCDFYLFHLTRCTVPLAQEFYMERKRLLEKMPPYHGGGEMIKEVTFEKTTYNDLPYKFEAGTPNIADVVAFKQRNGIYSFTRHANNRGT